MIYVYQKGGAIEKYNNKFVVVTPQTFTFDANNVNVVLIMR